MRKKKPEGLGGPYPEATVSQNVAGAAPVTSEDTQRNTFR